MLLKGIGDPAESAAKKNLVSFYFAILECKTLQTFRIYFIKLKFLKNQLRGSFSRFVFKNKVLKQKQ